MQHIRRVTNLQKIYLNSYKHNSIWISKKLPLFEHIIDDFNIGVKQYYKVWDYARPFYNKDYYKVADSFNEFDYICNNYVLHYFISYDIETNRINEEESYSLTSNQLKRFCKRLTYGIYILDIKHIKKLKENLS